MAYQRELTKEEVIKIFNNSQDPFYFIFEVLGIKRLTTEQRQIVTSVWLNKYTDVRACHSVGKTYILAAILLSFLFPNKDSIVVTTAPTGRQVKDLLWRDVNNMYSNAKFKLGGKCLTTDLNIAPKWYATGIATEPGKESESATKIQGYHAAKILVIGDEIFGIQKPILEALDGVASSDGAKFLGVGNPSSTNNPYALQLSKSGRGIKAIVISAFNHPNVVEKRNVIPGAVSYAWVLEKINDWCEIVDSKIDKTCFEYNKVVKDENTGELKTTDEIVIYKPNDLFLWKVMGEYPEQAVDSLVSYQAVYNSMERGKKVNILNPDDPARAVQRYIRVGAVDVARFGTNKSVFCKNINEHNTFKEFYKMDLADLSEESIKFITENKLTMFGIDCDGIGGGVYDNLNKWKENTGADIELVEIHGGAIPWDLDIDQTEEDEDGNKQSKTTQFFNLRSQMYWLIRLDIKEISIEYREDLLTGLSSIRYRFNIKGKIQVESKDEFKKRFNRSSDYEDALIYCNAMKYFVPRGLKMAFA